MSKIIKTQLHHKLNILTHFLILTGVCGVTELIGKANPVTYLVGCTDMAWPMPSPKVGVKPPIGAKGGTCEELC